MFDIEESNQVSLNIYPNEIRSTKLTHRPIKSEFVECTMHNLVRIICKHRVLKVTVYILQKEVIKPFSSRSFRRFYFSLWFNERQEEDSFWLIYIYWIRILLTLHQLWCRISWEMTISSSSLTIFWIISLLEKRRISR